MMNLARFVLSLLLIVCSANVSAREIVDATKTKVVFTDSPKKIVTLAPSLGELIADLLGNDLSKIIGVSEYTDYPPALKKVTSIGPYHHFNVEKVASLKPDLVFATVDGNQSDQIQHLRELKIPVLVVDTNSFDEIEKSMQLLGTALGSPQAGNQMAAQVKLGLQKIRKKYESYPKYRVMLQVGDDPVVVAGKKSFLNSALEVLGVQNVYGKKDSRYPQPSLEDIFQLDPEVIIIAAMGSDIRTYHKSKNKWLGFKNMKAVKNQRVLIIQSDALLRPTLRFLEGISQLAELIYGRS
jgi:iron complex transport system substrate-binding protein